ncbi:ATP-binding protein [Candidatus Saganbacteria bacterium]|nr:ATP-binding protein [Candidatus Saganbacteria bacterium]
MENPFIYGESVTKEYFCNRKTEIANLEKDVLASQKIFLISARRLGKTSLIKALIEKLKKKQVLTVFLDLEGFASYKEFLNAYLLALSRQATTLDKILSFLRNVIPGFRADLKMDELGQPPVSLGYDYPSSAFEHMANQIFELPEIIAKRQNKKLLIVFDEFQEILNLNGGTIEGKLRASIQHQRKVAYIFASSKQHLLFEMANSPQRPFYKVGPILFLEKIPSDEFAIFIKQKFLSGKIKISDETIEQIIKTAENIPYYVQMLCHELWDFSAASKKIEPIDIKTVLERLVSQSSSNFHLEWSRLIPSKRQVLKAIAIEGGEKVLSKNFLNKYQLGFPSKVNRSLLSLIDTGYLDKSDEGIYFYNDLLFREWVKRLKG